MLVGVIFEDGFGRSKKGVFVVVEDDFVVFFVVFDLLVIVNIVVLNGKWVEVLLMVFGVIVKGWVLNVISVVCRSFDVVVLKVLKDCFSVYVNGSEM